MFMKETLPDPKIEHHNMGTDEWGLVAKGGRKLSLQYSRKEQKKERKNIPGCIQVDSLSTVASLLERVLGVTHGKGLWTILNTRFVARSPQNQVQPQLSTTTAGRQCLEGLCFVEGTWEIELSHKTV